MMMRCHDVTMRTTIDLPDDLHRFVRDRAREEHRSLSEIVAELMRRGLQRDRPAIVGPRGLPVVTVGRPVTSQDVHRLEDEG